jgi:hypothetical protein
MIILLIFLLVLISLLILGGAFAQPISGFIQQRLPTRGYAGEQFVLWGGMLLTAFMIGLLVMYLFLRP